MARMKLKEKGPRQQGKEQTTKGKYTARRKPMKKQQLRRKIQKGRNTKDTARENSS